MNRLLAVIALVAATTAPAFANANDDVKNAMIALARASSYHMEIATGQGMQMSADVENPGRFHTYSPHAESIVVNGAMYMKMGGAWQKFPAAAMRGMPSPADFMKTMTAQHNDYVATDLGMRLAGGTMLHAYKVTSAAKGRTDTIYLDSSGKLARIEADASVIRFSKFNVPLNIHPPI